MLENVFQLVMIIQSFMAFIIGVLAAHQFKFNGAGSCMVGVAAMLDLERFNLQLRALF